MSLDEKKPHVYERSPYIVASLDLELNTVGWEIIQIGYCVGNLLTGEILSQNRIYVKCKEPLNRIENQKTGLCDITKLTGITQEQVDAAEPLITYYPKLDELHNQKFTFTQEGKEVQAKPFRNVLTWGGGDSDCLKDQLLLQAEDNPELKAKIRDDFIFGRRWIDVKSICQFYCLIHNIPMRGGLAKQLARLGMTFFGKKHDGLDDAINTFRVYHWLYHNWRKT